MLQLRCRAIPGPLQVSVWVRMARFDPIVKYKDEAFNILEIPKSNSALVKEHEDLVLTSADLDSLVSDLSLVGKFTRIAYNGVAGYTDLQIKIRRIAVDVTKLCRESTILVREFKLKSSTILVDLQATYQFLIDGMEDMAIVTLQSTATEAQGMAEAAERLANAFEKESKLVENAHGDTLKTKDAEKKRKDDLEEKMKRLEIERTKRVTESAAVEQDIAFHGQQYARADARHAAYETSSDGFFEAIYNFFTGRNDERIRAAREDKERHLQEMSKLRRIRSKALADIAEFSKKMENCQEESELTEAAIQSLHKAIGGLKALSNVMRRISDFWKTLELECKKLGGEDMRKMIEEAMRRPEEKRAAVWGSTSFKNKALLYYARWVALGNICGTSYEKMKLTQNELYEYLEENPTTEEARRNVRQLAIIFSKELEVEQKAIAQKESEGQREMIALGGE